MIRGIVKIAILIGVPVAAGFAFGWPAGVGCGVYGVVMLVAGFDAH